MPYSNDGGTSRDSYRLEELAEEVASRDSRRISASAVQKAPMSEAGDSLNLPEHSPLSHEDKHLSAEIFNVEDFLLARSHLPLADLRAELRQYHATLKEELIKLINDDYEAFISLSTDLRDEGPRLSRLRYPLENMKFEVLESKGALQVLQDAVHSKLTNRSKLREEKALLHLLLKISESVTRLESLLSITSPDHVEKERMEFNDINFTVYSSRIEDSLDEKFRSNRAKHLSRVAVEYTQLLYHVRKAQSENCAFITELQWRIDRIHSTLCSDLDQLFAETLVLLTSPNGDNKGTELERHKWTADLTECLRTYDTLGLWRDAEDVLRHELVRTFVKKEIHSGALMAPHSPIVPLTPFNSSNSNLKTPTTTSYHIPYTPFTAFIPKQPLHFSTVSHLSLSQAHLLDDTDNPLAALYNKILRFVERDICRIMGVAEKIEVRYSVEQKRPIWSTVNGDLGRERSRFEIMSNVVWDEFGRSIMEELGNVVFSVGRPDEFRKNYETTQAFIRSLEMFAPQLEDVDAMRRHPTYQAFERRWQLPVYFQLRWKEIVGQLEQALISARVESSPKDGPFCTRQAAATWIAISACWSSDVYIPDLSHRFWKLTLQILNRYKAWISQDMALSESDGREKHTSRVPSAGTSIEPSSIETNAVDDTTLRQCTAVMADIRIMETNVRSLWQQVIKVMILGDHGVESLNMEDALQESIHTLTSFLEPLSDQIIVILTKRCCDALLPVRSIPSQFRAMSNKRIPSEPSYFVSSILKPVRQFFGVGMAGGIGGPLRDDFLKSFATEVFNNVTQRYIGYLATMRKTEESLKRLKNKKPTYSLFGGSSSANDIRDEERIRTQMILDVEAFGKDASSLQIDVDANATFAALKDVVYTTESD